MTVQEVTGSVQSMCNIELAQGSVNERVVGSDRHFRYHVWRLVGLGRSSLYMSPSLASVLVTSEVLETRMDGTK